MIIVGFKKRVHSKRLFNISLVLILILKSFVNTGPDYEKLCEHGGQILKSFVNTGPDYEKLCEHGGQIMNSFVNTGPDYGN